MFKLENRSHKLRGYTLVELVIVMALLLIVGTLVMGILTTALRGSIKSKITSDVAQNGNYAMSIMSGIIINSQKFLYITSSGVPTASCSSFGTTGQSITVSGFDGGITTFACDATNNTVSSNSASLLDLSQVKVVTGTCSFTCIQPDLYSAPRIDIAFQLQNATGTTVEKTTQASFSTSVSIRNFNLDQ